MTIAALLSLVVYIAVLAIVFALLWWLLEQLGLPGEIMRIIRIAIVVIAVIVVIGLLLSLTGNGFPLIIHSP